MAVTFTLNGREVVHDGDPAMPILWFVREKQGLTGSKFGCGVASCGACTMHLDGSPVRTCVTPVSAAEGRSVTTIEGLQSAEGRAVQAAWRELDVVQCGYCQSGQIMAATALLQSNPSPSDDDINAAMQGNLCRCATYHRIRAAIHSAAGRLAG
ncbi:MAG TPA: (2Fe-2S)-binding protein [Gammaproteobacteria bacterium]|nr:(2Fe-2S)-binding protein [Gammaproteobacteria bacterium]